MACCGVLLAGASDPAGGSCRWRFAGRPGWRHVVQCGCHGADAPASATIHSLTGRTHTKAGRDHSGCPLGRYSGVAFCFGGLRPTLGTRPPTGSFPDDLVSNGASRYGRWGERYFGRQRLVGLVVPPRGPGRPAPAGRRAAATAREAREAHEKAPKASVCADRCGGSGSGGYQCVAGPTGTRVHPGHWLPANRLIGGPGCAADSPGLPACLGRG